VSVIEEQMEALGDDELALVISRFSRFHNNRINRRRGGVPKDGCYGCGDPDHFIAHCPKKNKHSSSKHDAIKRKDKRKYTFNKHKSKGGFDKETIKKEFIKKVKAHKRAFFDCLSDREKDSTDSDSSTSSDNESKRKIKDKLSGLCFHADTTKQGLYTTALGDEVETGKDEASGDDDTSQVSLFANELTVEVETLSAALTNQDKLVKCTARERNDFKAKLEIALRELEFAKTIVVVSDETECDACAIHMTNLSNLQTKYASSLDENDELKSRPILLGGCKSYSSLQSELVEKNVKIFALEKASLDSAAAGCARCEGLELEIESCRHDKMRIEEDNINL
jgi:hypothetical protein